MRRNHADLLLGSAPARRHLALEVHTLDVFLHEHELRLCACSRAKVIQVCGDSVMVKASEHAGFALEQFVALPVFHCAE
jgi:hypothetical protein